MRDRGKHKIVWTFLVQKQNFSKKKSRKNACAEQVFQVNVKDISLVSGGGRGIVTTLWIRLSNQNVSIWWSLIRGYPRSDGVVRVDRRTSRVHKTVRWSQNTDAIRLFDDNDHWRFRTWKTPAANNFYLTGTHVTNNRRQCGHEPRKKKVDYTRRVIRHEKIYVVVAHVFRSEQSRSIAYMRRRVYSRSLSRRLFGVGHPSPRLPLNSITRLRPPVFRSSPGLLFSSARVSFTNQARACFLSSVWKSLKNTDLLCWCT